MSLVVQLLLFASAAVLAVPGSADKTDSSDVPDTTPTVVTTEATASTSASDGSTSASDASTSASDGSTEESSTAAEVNQPFPLPADCFVRCPDGPGMVAVCGTDSRVYDSECHLMVANCRKNVTVGDWEDCRGQHPLCPTNCLHIYDPVCGEDGKIYPNLCVLHSNNCGKPVRLEELRYCLSKAREFRDYQPCPRQCQDVYEPVCSSTGQVFTNECYMRLYTCGQGAAIVEMQNCVKTPECPAACTPIYDPVCGSDGRVYLNHCRFSQANCGKQIEKMPRSFCEEKMLLGQAPPTESS